MGGGRSYEHPQAEPASARCRPGSAEGPGLHLVYFVKSSNKVYTIIAGIPPKDTPLCMLLCYPASFGVLGGVYCDANPHKNCFLPVNLIFGGSILSDPRRSESICDGCPSFDQMTRYFPSAHNSETVRDALTYVNIY